MVGICGMLLLILAIGTILRHWVWIAVAAAVVVALVLLVKFTGRLDRWLERWEERRMIARYERAAIAFRADKQNAWALAGDDSGIYGDYRPEI